MLMEVKKKELKKGKMMEMVINLLDLVNSIILRGYKIKLETFFVTGSIDIAKNGWSLEVFITDTSLFFNFKDREVIEFEMNYYGEEYGEEVLEVFYKDEKNEKFFGNIFQGAINYYKKGGEKNEKV